MASAYLTSPNPGGGGGYYPLDTTTPSTTWLYGAYGFPSILAVNQGSIGDCWCLATLIEIAAFDPGGVQSMITWNGGGYYTVRLVLNGVVNYIQVGDDLPSGANSGAGYGNWASLIEKAYAAALGSYAALNGNTADFAFAALAGQSCTDLNLSNGNYNTAKSQIIDALSAGKGVVLNSSDLFIPQSDPLNSAFSGSFPAIDYNSATGNAEGLAVNFSSGSHCYAVVGYDGANGNLILRNPWGQTGSTSYSAGGVNYANAYVSKTTESTSAITVPSGFSGYIYPGQACHFLSEFEISASDLQYFSGGAVTNAPLTSFNYVSVSLFNSDRASLDSLSGGFDINDAAANVAANFDVLSNDSHVGGIVLTDGGIPILNITSNQLTNDGNAQYKITNPIVEYLVPGIAPIYAVVTYGAAGSPVPLSTSSCTVWLRASSHMDLTGSYDTVFVAGGSNFSVIGTSDTIYVDAGDGAWIGGNGAGGAADVVNGDDAVVYALGNSNVQVAGSRDIIVIGGGSNVGVNGAGDTVYASAGDGVWIGGNGAGGAADVVNGSNDAVYAYTNSNVQVVGSGDVVLAAVSLNAGVIGTADTIYASAGDGVWIGGNGSGGAADVVKGSSAVVYASPNSNVQMVGSSDVLLAGNYSNIGVIGSSNETYAGSGDGIWISNGWGDYLNVGANDTVYDSAVFTHIDIYGAVGGLNIYNFAADASGVINLFDGIGGFASSQAALQALTSDGNGGSKLNLGSAGYIDFVGDTSLTAASFKVG